MVNVKQSKRYRLPGTLLTGVLGGMLLAVVVVSAMTSTASAADVAVPAKAPVAPAQQNGDLNCADFESQAAAQQEFESNPSDPHGLDADNDGRACEDWPAEDGNGNGSTKSPESLDGAPGAEDGTDGELPVTGADPRSLGLLVLLGSVALISGVWIAWRFRRSADA